MTSTEEAVRGIHIFGASIQDVLAEGTMTELLSLVGSGGGRRRRERRGGGAFDWKPGGRLPGVAGGCQPAVVVRGGSVRDGPWRRMSARERGHVLTKASF